MAYACCEFIESTGLWDEPAEVRLVCEGCCASWLDEALLTTEARCVFDDVGKMGEPVLLSLTGEVGESVESLVFFFFRNPKEGM